MWRNVRQGWSTQGGRTQRWWSTDSWTRGMSYINKHWASLWADRTNISVLPNLDKIFTGCWAIFCDDTSLSVLNISAVSQLSQLFRLQSPSEPGAGPQIVKCSQITIFLSHPKSQNKANQVSQITSPDQIFKTQILPDSRFPLERTLLLIHDWILLLIAIHLCNLFPWLPLDSPHFAGDSPSSSDVFVMSQCPLNHQPSPPIHRKWALDTAASQNPWR